MALPPDHPVEQGKELFTALPERQEDGNEGGSQRNEEAQDDLKFEVASAPGGCGQREAGPNDLHQDETDERSPPDLRATATECPSNACAHIRDQCQDLRPSAMLSVIM